MQTPGTQSPINPIPPVVIILFLLVIGVEAVLSLGARGIIGGPMGLGWRLSAIQDYGFSVEILDWMWGNARWPFEHVRRFVTYLFVHPSFTSALVASVMLLALGKFVGEVFLPAATLAVFFLSGIGGAAVFGFVVTGPSWLSGAFPAVYGLIGAFTYILWTRLGEIGANQTRAFTLIGVLMGLQLVFGLMFGPSPVWIAEISGFVIGFLSSFILRPGGWMALRDRIRHD